MIFRKVDNDGYFLEDVILESQPMIFVEGEDGIMMEVPDQNYVQIQCPEGMIKPKWDGYKWIEGFDPEIHTLAKTVLSENEKIWDVLSYLLNN